MSVAPHWFSPLLFFYYHPHPQFERKPDRFDLADQNDIVALYRTYYNHQLTRLRLMGFRVLEEMHKVVFNLSPYDWQASTILSQEYNLIIRPNTIYNLLKNVQDERDKFILFAADQRLSASSKFVFTDDQKMIGISFRDENYLEDAIRELDRTLTVLPQNQQAQVATEQSQAKVLQFGRNEEMGRRAA